MDHPHHVLVVEDDSAIQKFVRGILENEGCRVTTTGKTSDAVKISRSDVDMIVLDVTLDEPDGKEVLERLRAEGNYVPVIVMSAQDRPAVRSRLEELGIVYWLTKPFEVADLRNIIRKALRTSTNIGRIKSANGELSSFIQRQEERHGTRFLKR